MDMYPLLLCVACRYIEQRQTITITGACSECAGQKFRPAYKIDDATEARLKAEGFEFDDEWFSEEPTL